MFYFPLFGNGSSQGGPQHESGGPIGLIAESRAVQPLPHNGRYLAFPGLAVDCEIPPYRDSFAPGSFYNGKGKRGREWALCRRQLGVVGGYG